MYPQYWSNCSAVHVISSLIWNIWSRIARIFGRIVNKVDDKPRFGDCDVFDCFCNELGLVYLACKVVLCDQVAFDHWSSLLYWEPPSKQLSISWDSTVDLMVSVIYLSFTQPAYLNWPPRWTAPCKIAIFVVDCGRWCVNETRPGCDGMFIQRKIYYGRCIKDIAKCLSFSAL